MVDQVFIYILSLALLVLIVIIYSLPRFFYKDYPNSSCLRACELVGGRPRGPRPGDGARRVRLLRQRHLRRRQDTQDLPGGRDTDGGGVHNIIGRLRHHWGKQCSSTDIRGGAENMKVLAKNIVFFEKNMQDNCKFTYFSCSLPLTPINQFPPIFSFRLSTRSWCGATTSPTASLATLPARTTGTPPAAPGSSPPASPTTTAWCCWTQHSTTQGTTLSWPGRARPEPCHWPTRSPAARTSSSTSPWPGATTSRLRLPWGRGGTYTPLVPPSTAPTSTCAAAFESSPSTSGTFPWQSLRCGWIRRYSKTPSPSPGRSTRSWSPTTGHREGGGDTAQGEGEEREERVRNICLPRLANALLEYIRMISSTFFYTLEKWCYQYFYVPIFEGIVTLKSHPSEPTSHNYFLVHLVKIIHFPK